MLGNILAMVIVIPALSGNTRVFGIYSIVTSLTMYLGYADLGIINAGQKLAAEAYVNRERRREEEILGFVVMVLLIGVGLFITVAILLSLFPMVLSRNLAERDSADIASSLLRLTSLSAAAVIFQRFNAIMYGARLKQYIVQRTEVALSMSKLAVIPLSSGRTPIMSSGIMGFAVAFPLSQHLDCVYLDRDRSVSRSFPFFIT